jgi:hypothetical protein
MAPKQSAEPQPRAFILRVGTKPSHRYRYTYIHIKMDEFQSTGF